MGLPVGQSTAGCISVMMNKGCQFGLLSRTSLSYHIGDEGYNWWGVGSGWKW